MRVGLDLLYLVPGESGGRETYARELVPALLEHAPELELVVFVNRDAGAELAFSLAAVAQAVVVPISARSRAQWAAGELALVALAAQHAHVELLHSLANFAPCWGRFRRVVTIHDLQYRAVPDRISLPVRAMTGALVSLAARGAERIIAVSHAGAQELVSELGVDPARIDVVPNGVRPSRGAPATAAIREQLRLGERPLALAVATNLPHKNLPALIDALAAVDVDERPLLTIAGHATDDGSLRARAQAAGVEQDVRLLGTCSTEQLDALYAASSCLVLPTLHEGFGLPVLEAMARSLPVTCSDIAALREVAGPAALYFDPHEPAQIAASITRLLSDGALARRLADAGRVRAASFSWSAAAEGTLASYERALASETTGR
jgi:glycosyltransferase involved in cell wall biosynthesis